MQMMSVSPAIGSFVLYSAMDDSRSVSRAAQLTSLLRRLQGDVESSPPLFAHPNPKEDGRLRIPTELSIPARMQLEMSCVQPLLIAVLNLKTIVKAQRSEAYTHMEVKASLESMLEESSDMYAGLELECDKQRNDLDNLKYMLHRITSSCASILADLRVILQKEKDFPELKVLVQSKHFLCICEAIIVEAATNIMNSDIINIEEMSTAVLLLQKITDQSDGIRSLVELELYHDKEKRGVKRSLVWAIIALFCKQSNCRQNLAMILLAFTKTKDSAEILVSHHLDRVIVSVLHCETDNSIKEISLDILCSLASLDDVRCLRMFRSSPEAAAQFIKSLKRETSSKIKHMSDYLAGKLFEQLQYCGPQAMQISKC